MDPVAHTLFGAALAESGLKRRSRYATATLVIGANLPDVDVMAGLWGSDFELYFRRGHTHGILAMLVLPMLLAGAITLWHRWRSGAYTDVQLETARAGVPASPAFRPGAIVLLAFLGVWSHPLLDWTNTYGVRLLMPFDDRWFYGDTLFIIDPWFWLLTAAGVLLARSRTRTSLAAWSVLGLLASVLVLGSGTVALPAQWLWGAGLALLVALRWWRPACISSQRAARTGVAVLLCYILAAFALARSDEAGIARRFTTATQVQSNPVPGNPFVHRTVVVEESHYRILDQHGTVHTLARQSPDAIVQAALSSPSIRGFTNWMRFPQWSVEETPQHWLVRIQDLRYQGPGDAGARGFGGVEVMVPKDKDRQGGQP